jgi:hypothetical protein
MDRSEKTTRFEQQRRQIMERLVVLQRANQNLSLHIEISPAIEKPTPQVPLQTTMNIAESAIAYEASQPQPEPKLFTQEEALNMVREAVDGLVNETPAHDINLGDSHEFELPS